MKEIKEKFQEFIDRNCFLIHENGKMGRWTIQFATIFNETSLVDFASFQKIRDIPFTTPLGDEIIWNDKFNPTYVKINGKVLNSYANQRNKL